MPYIASNRFQRSGDSGAVDDDMTLSVGKFFPVSSSGLLISMLITVGTPTENVMPLSIIQPAKRLCEKWRAKCNVQPVMSHAIRLMPCAELQPNDRYSRVLSSEPTPVWSIEHKPNDQWDIWLLAKILGLSVVPDVQ